MRARAYSVALALLAGACGDGVLAQGTVATGGGGAALAFVALTPMLAGLAPDPDVVVASPRRGELDVLVESCDGWWRNIGSFYAGGAAEDLAVGRIGGRGAVAVRDQGGSVSLLAADSGMPHRLTFPVYVYRRLRNGQPVDNSPPAKAIALADLDGDGSDELLVATPDGVLVIVGMASFLDANPEHPPPANGFRLDAGPSPNAVAAVNLGGSGHADLLALDAEEPVARLYRHGAGGAGDFAPPVELALPAAGRLVVATGCAELPARVLLADGRVVAIAADATVVPPADATVTSPADATVTSPTDATVTSPTDAIGTLVASRDALVVGAAPANALTLYDACTRVGVALGLPPSRSVAMASAAAASYEHVAELSSDGANVSLYRVFTGF